MNLGTLITEAQRLAGRVDTDFRTRTRRWINEAQEQWALEIPWASLERIETFVTNGTKDMLLPPRVLQVQWIGDRTNKYPLDPGRFPQREFPYAYFGGTAGRASFWRPLGVSPVSRALAAASTVQVQTATSDSFSVYVSGTVLDTNASGTPDEYHLAEEEINVTSSGPHVSSNTYVRVETIGKDDITTSDVVMRDSSSNVIARIAAHAYDVKYPKIELLYVPSAGVQLDVGYIQRPQTLFHDYQIPNVSIDREYLIWYAAGMIHAAQGQEQNSAIKIARANEILQRRVDKDKLHGEKDFRSLPEPSYWNNEDQYTWPDNQIY
jgi:hypothetical protein